MMSDGGDVLVETVIQVFDHEHILDFDFDRSKKITRLVMNSHTFRSSLEHFDMIGLVTTVSMNKETPKFSIRSDGVVGHVQVDYSDDLVNEEAPFRCAYPVSHNYQTSFIKKWDQSFRETNNLFSSVLKACQYSTHVSFRIDSAGVLQVQHLLIFPVSGDKNENIFLTFFVNPDFQVGDNASVSQNSYEPTSLSSSSTATA